MNKWGLWLLAISAVSFGAAPVITPSVPIVYVSSTMQMNADQTVTWSLTQSSTGTINSVTGVYTAPGPIRAKHTWLGCPLLPQDSIYNTDISNLPVQLTSNTYFHNQIATVTLGVEPDMPENLYTNSSPQTNMVFHFTSGANGNFPLLGFPDMAVENGIFTAQSQVDQHILGMNKDTCQASEIYALTKIGQLAGCPTCNSGSGVKYSDGYALNQGVDAAGMYVAALAVSGEDMRNCIDRSIPIGHSLRMTAALGDLSNGFKWPATASATDAGSLPFGTLVRLKSSFTPTGSAAAQCIEVALQKHGAFLIDGGIRMHVQFMASSTEDSDTYTALLSELPSVSGLNSNNFEVVDQTTLEDLDANSPTFKLGIVTATNPYVVPSNFAVVVASNTTTHLSSYTPIIIEPVTIGVERYQGYAFMAGAPATQLNVWVNGSTDTTKTCTMSPTLGTLTSSGLYTAPASTVARSSTTVTCVATMDAGASIAFPVVVYPTTAIREHLSNTTTTDYGPDVNGNTWFYDDNAKWTFSGTANCDWTGDPWTGVTDAGLYKHCRHKTNGTGDVLYKFVVPNGTYKLTLLYGIGGSSPFAAGDWQEGIDSQGVIFNSTPSTTTLSGNGPWTELGLTGYYFDLCTLISGCAQQTPGKITFNSVVSDNNLYFAIRHLAPANVSQPRSVLTAFSIEPVAASVLQINGGVQIKGGDVLQ